MYINFFFLFFSVIILITFAQCVNFENEKKLLIEDLIDVFCMQVIAHVEHLQHLKLIKDYYNVDVWRRQQWQYEGCIGNVMCYENILIFQKENTREKR